MRPTSPTRLLHAQVYAEVKGEVERGIAYLLRRRLDDPYRELVSRLVGVLRGKRWAMQGAQHRASRWMTPLGMFDKGVEMHT